MVNVNKSSPVKGDRDRALTVVIPFYTGLPYLRRAIGSVLEQSTDAWRLIVLDDSGCGEGADVLASLDADPRIEYVKNCENLGMASAWNRCLDLSCTDLVTLLHADDQLLPNYVSLMLTEADSYPNAAAFFCRARIIDEHGNKIFSPPDMAKALLTPISRKPYVLNGQSALTALLRGNFIVCPTICYRKSRLNMRRFSNDWRFVLDWEFMCGLLLAGEHIVGLNKVVFAYRRHGVNATEDYTRTLLRFREESAFLDVMHDKALAQNWCRAARSARWRWTLRINLIYSAIRDLVSSQFLSAREKLAFLLKMRWDFYKRT